MQTYFVRVECDVTANVHTQPFRYRAYINNELFAERTWIWDNCYLKENFQIQAAPGVYSIKFEVVDTGNGTIEVSRYRINSDLIQDKITTLLSDLYKINQHITHAYGHSDLSYFNDPTQDGKQIVKNILEQIDQENVSMQTARIIDYQGETAVEISNASI